ncbi:2-oxo acid dehydrogenase subunit E2 [Jeotgalibacillus sp. S-D1]|uniref:dihydrolipoamide acetyltransferase family protein n=1 Tax=Jeotgalibacillus sp. S-D1 TaxID=2552189 RepID=UPI00105A531D|nr:dihydrolipoamide acetyltransferase family protein [Jeotgalibacillus sp. S-D1]TDL35517.1 2-oxo acid dehydrogenase subunit E2 [Jeotgalibacillus sp. S-D1]
MEVKLHDIGEGMTQADINQFFVQPGDTVKADDPLVEVQTDKMTAEIPSPASGVIKELKVEIGSTISVGTTVLIIESKDKKTVPGSVGEEKEMKLEPFTVQRNFVKHQQEPSKRTLASPYTRKIARENDIDLEYITGTGKGNRITDEDVYSAIKNNQQSADIKKQESEQEVKTIPYSGMRKQIGKKMTESLLTIPHCTHFEEVDVTELLKVKEQLKEKGKNISATVFFIKALSICLKEFPLFNAFLDEKNEMIHLHEKIHIGLATDTSEGLIVPVIHHVQNQSFSMLQKKMKELVDKANAHALTLEDVTGGTFTISNVGPLGGSTGATPILNKPEIGLMAFHKTKKRPMVNELDEIVVRSMMNISMSYDHRVVDGASAVAFTNRFTELIERPTLLFVELM